MNKKLITAAVLATGALITNSAPVFGAVSCVTQYGVSAPYGQICVSTGEIQVNKEVFDPQNKKFVDNLGLTSHHFAAGEEVTFRLTIKNIGDNTLDNVQVTDTLPSFLEQVAGQEYSFNINKLVVNQSVQKEVKARVVPISKLPNDKTVVCDVNTAVAQSGDKRDQDTAQVCSEKKVAKELPKAGAEDTFVTLLSSGVFGYLGLKFAKIKKIVK